jgi:hypothetical protein
MDNNLSQIGVAGVLITLWTKMFFDYLKAKKAEPEEEGDGGLRETLKLLSENMIKQTEILREIRDEQKDMARTIMRLELRPNGACQP